MRVVGWLFVVLFLAFWWLLGVVDGRMGRESSWSAGER